MMLGVRVKRFSSRDDPPPGDPPRRGWIFAFFGAATGVAVIVPSVTLGQWDTAVAIFLLMIAILRVYSLYRSVAWIWKRGYTFDQTWRHDLTADQRAQVVD